MSEMYNDFFAQVTQESAPGKVKGKAGLTSKRVGLKMRKARKACGMSQTHMGDMLGFTGGAISLWESGKNEPSFDTLRAFAGMCGVSLASLFEVDNMP